jgi:hypothetical protein
VVLSSNNATAAVEGELTVDDASVTLVDQSLQDILIDMTAEWSYQSNVRVDSVECEVHVGARASSLDMIARQTTAVDAPDQSSGSGTTNLTGSMAEASDFAVSDMVPATGSVTHTALAELRVFIVSAGETQAEAIIRDTFTVTISQEDVSVTVSASGTGSVSFVTQ